MHQLNQWHPGYSVFVKELDDHHKELINLLNELYDAYLQNSHKEKVGDIISRLFDYTTIHFAAEESYFVKFEYEQTSQHKKEHQQFLDKIKTFQADYSKNSTVLTLQIINFLHEWIHHHIMNTDRNYIICFRKGGLK